MTDTARLLALLLFNRQFQAMIDFGMNLTSCADHLSRTAPEPYRSFAKEILEKLPQGYYLSAIYAARPDLFSRYYTALMRVGEYGGVLDEILGHLNELLTEELEFTRALEQAPPLEVILPTPPEEQLAMLLFCRSVSTLLTLGVPQPLSLEVAVEILPEERRGPARAIIQAEPREEALVRLETSGLLAPLAAQLLHMGRYTGEIAYAMRQAADLYHDQLSYLLGISVQRPRPTARVLTGLPDTLPPDESALLLQETDALFILLREAGYAQPMPISDAEDFLANPRWRLWHVITLLAIQRSASMVELTNDGAVLRLCMDGMPVRDLPAALFAPLAEIVRHDDDYAWRIYRQTYLLHTTVAPETIRLTLHTAAAAALDSLRRLGVAQTAVPTAEGPAVLLDALLQWLRQDDIDALRLEPVWREHRGDCYISVLRGKAWQPQACIPAGIHLVKDVEPVVRERAGMAAVDREGTLDGLRVSFDTITFKQERDGAEPYQIKATMLEMRKA